MRPRTGLVIGFAEKANRELMTGMAARAEELGYETAWMGETWGRDVLTSLTHMASHTSRIKLATGIVSVYSRTPALVGQSMASLDEISGGRAVLGLGASSERITENWHGVPFDRPLQRTREYIEIINLVTSGQRVDYEGRFFRMKGFRLQFTPARDHIPVYLAALGPKNLELTGELCDGWVPAYVDNAYLPTFRNGMASGAAKSGRPVDSIDQAPWVLTCALEDAAAARELARDHLGFFVAGYGHFYYDLVVRYGFGEEAARIKELWAIDRSAVAAGVSEEMLDRLSVSGSPEHCRRKYDELVSLGIGAPTVMLPSTATMDVTRETVEALAPRHWG